MVSAFSRLHFEKVCIMVKPEAPSIGPAGQFGDSHLPGPINNKEEHI